MIKIQKNIKGIKDSLLASSDLDEIKIDGEHPVAHFIKEDIRIKFRFLGVFIFASIQ